MQPCCYCLKFIVGLMIRTCGSQSLIFYRHNQQIQHSKKQLFPNLFKICFLQQIFFKLKTYAQVISTQPSGVSGMTTSLQAMTGSKNRLLSFPGGSVVRSQPANAGDIGSIPGLGRFHMLQSNKAHAPTMQPMLQSPGATDTELTCYNE